MTYLHRLWQFWVIRDCQFGVISGIFVYFLIYLHRQWQFWVILCYLRQFVLSRRGQFTVISYRFVYFRIYLHRLWQFWVILCYLRKFVLSIRGQFTVIFFGFVYFMIYWHRLCQFLVILYSFRLFVLCRRCQYNVISGRFVYFMNICIDCGGFGLCHVHCGSLYYVDVVSLTSIFVYFMTYLNRLWQFQVILCCLRQFVLSRRGQFTVIIFGFVYICKHCVSLGSFYVPCRRLYFLDVVSKTKFRVYSCIL